MLVLGGPGHSCIWQWWFWFGWNRGSSVRWRHVSRPSSAILANHCSAARASPAIARNPRDAFIQKKGISWLVVRRSRNIIIRGNRETLSNIIMKHYVWNIMMKDDHETWSWNKMYSENSDKQQLQQHAAAEAIPATTTATMIMLTAS